jgi:Haloacid dehalogenase-like hydrolase
VLGLLHSRVGLACAAPAHSRLILLGRFDNLVFGNLRNQHIFVIHQHRVGPRGIETGDACVGPLLAVAQMKGYLFGFCHRATSWCEISQFMLIDPHRQGMAKYAGLPWDCILSAELAHHYKPDPETYQMAADLLGLRPEQAMMVAAHKGDLRAAQAVGLQAAFVTRPMEFGPERTPDLTPDPVFTIHAVDFHDLAAQLGV